MANDSSTSPSATGSRTRSPYVVKACQECRRRKIKCNGNEPCQRCGRLSLSCSYRAKRQHNSHPENLDLPSILAELNALRAENDALRSGSELASSASRSSASDTSRRDKRRKDPLEFLPVDEIYRLMRVYNDNIHFQYPLADLDAVLESADTLSRHRKSALTGTTLDAADSACLKLVLANAMVVDSRGYGDLPIDLYESLRPYLASLPECRRLTVKGLRVIVLLAAYHIIRDNAITAWRNIGFAVRTAIELGLNIQRNVERMFPDPRKLRSIQELYWSIYILDHCWSLHMGLGYAMLEADPKVGIKEPDDSMPFLRAMVDCTKIVSRSWNVICPTINQIDGLSLRDAQERLEDVYREIREWQSSAAVSTYFYKQPDALSSWQSRCLQTFLYLRANELCIYLCKPILITRNSLAENRGTMEFATTLAKDSISVLVDFHRNSSALRMLPFIFDQFLSSALASLFLAIIQEPHRYVTRDGDCRASILAAKDLVNDLKANTSQPRLFYDWICQDFAHVNGCRILGRDPEELYDEEPGLPSQAEFDNALSLIEPLFGRIGHPV